MRIIFIFFILLLTTNCSPEKNFENANSNQQIKVALQPLESFPKALQDTLKVAIEQFYGFEVVKLVQIPIPKNFHVTYKSPRYRADSIINFLRHQKKIKADFVVGLTQVDISTTKKDKNGNIKKPASKYFDWGVFGLGYQPGKSCVISSYRLKKNKNKFINRLKKVTLHELGHNLGLPHCDSKYCFMQDAAETIRTIDKVKLNLCKRCENFVKK